ncbi:hypothetical protein KEM54_000964 [Ascosphaera aggregata]|nr:hypothetical protein KEM54_000964 [Ascosphaera aggregata]
MLGTTVRSRLNQFRIDSLASEARQDASLTHINTVKDLRKSLVIFKAPGGQGQVPVTPLVRVLRLASYGIRNGEAIEYYQNPFVRSFHHAYMLAGASVLNYVSWKLIYLDCLNRGQTKGSTFGTYLRIDIRARKGLRCRRHLDHPAKPIWSTSTLIMQESMRGIALRLLFRSVFSGHVQGLIHRRGRKYVLDVEILKGFSTLCPLFFSSLWWLGVWRQHILG